MTVFLTTSQLVSAAGVASGNIASKRSEGDTRRRLLIKEKWGTMRGIKGVLRTPGRYVRKHTVSVLLERYRRGELSVGDVARALSISLLHAKKIISQAQDDANCSPPTEQPEP